MKTKELIRQLQKVDPSGEEEVCVANMDILTVDSLPAYYDGPAQVLIRDSEDKIIGGRYKRSGIKVQIFSAAFVDMISNEGAFEVDYSELNPDQAAVTRKVHDDLREWYKRLEVRCELRYFLAWVKSQVEEADHEDIEFAVGEFFEQHISPDDPLPPGGVPAGQSYVECRHTQWAELYNPHFKDGFFTITVRD